MAKRIIFILSITLFVIVSQSNSQTKHSELRKSESEILINPQLLDNRIIVTDKNGVVSRGFLVGLKADTIIFNRQDEQFKYSVNNLANLKIDIEPNNTKGFVIGGLLGIYFANFAFLREENQPMAYMEEDRFQLSLLMSFLFGAVGGGLGYIIETNSFEDEVVFTFSDDGNNLNIEFERLRNFIIGKERENLLHISVQLSQVYTRLSELNNIYYSNTTSFNLLRKLQFSYSFFDKISFGIAVCWLGEPSIDDWNFEDLNHTSNYTRQNYNGAGYYAIGVYEPLRHIFPKSVSLKVGVGLGLAKIDYKLYRLKEIYIEDEYIIESSGTNINKYGFSGLIFTNLDFYLNNLLSLGFSADYIYLQETMPAIPELNLKSRNFGNYSLGINFSLHF